MSEGHKGCFQGHLHAVVYLWTADLGKIAKAFKTERFDDMGNSLVEKVKGWLDQYALNIPASAKLEIGDYTISNADLQAVREASSTKALREAVANLFDSISGLTLGDFEEGLDLTVYGGKYHYTVNLTLVK